MDGYLPMALPYALDDLLVGLLAAFLRERLPCLGEFLLEAFLEEAVHGLLLELLAR